MAHSEQDNTTLGRAKHGERAAIAEVVEGLRGRIARLARYYALRSAEEPGDLEQEAWVAILEAIPRVRLDVGDPREYLIKTGRWRMLNYLDEQKRRRHDAVPDDFDEPVAAQAPGRAATGHVLDCLFERLTDRQAVVLRALLAGHTSAEIARLLGCSTANLAWHVGRIRDVYRDLQSG